MLVALAVAAAAASSSITVHRGPFAEPPAACKTNGMMQTGFDPALLYRKDGKAKVDQLGALPKPNLEKTVVRTIDGCAAPVVVRYGVGR